MQYVRPPIVEAILELRVNATLDDDQIAKIAAKFAAEYPFSEDQMSLKIEVNPQSAEVRQVPEWKGKKLSSSDQVDVVGVRSNAFACMRLAPYGGWDALCSRARAGWQTFRVLLEHPQVSRIGVRFINRIDIPFGAGQIDIEDYLTAGPRLPELAWGPISNYTVQVVRPWPADKCSLTMTTGVVQSPLVGHISILLDIDLSASEVNLMREEDIWSLVTKMHDHKNTIFEGCITDKSRELFSR